MAHFHTYPRTVQTAVYAAYNTGLWDRIPRLYYAGLEALIEMGLTVEYLRPEVMS